jgi:hypothetical protein
VGLLVLIVALVAMAAPAFRWVNTVLAIWLFFSTPAFPHGNTGTVWNSLIIAAVVFVLSLLPNSVPTSSARAVGRS